MSRKLTRAEYAFYINTQEIVQRVKEKRRNRRKNRSLYNLRENYKQPVHYSGTLVCLIKNGFTFEQALEMLRK